MKRNLQYVDYQIKLYFIQQYDMISFELLSHAAF